MTETEGDEVKTYTYDDNGNTLSNGEQTFTYDARNRQITATVDEYEVSYTYNANGLRTSKTAAFVLSNYIWVGQNMVCEYSYTTTDGDTYVYGHMLISDGDSLYVYNGHGDVTAIVSPAGIVLQTYDYDAFGVEVSPDEEDENPFRYAGQYYDTETGTYYLRARYYDPATGRFTQQDNWGYADPEDPLSLNLYVYCYGNPVAFVDITGRFPSFISSIKEFIRALCNDFKNFNLFNSDVKTVYEAQYFSAYKGTLVIRHSDGFLSSWALFGIIFLNHSEDGNGEDSYLQKQIQTLNHEYGHILQEKILGILYYLKYIFIPSSVYNLSSREPGWLYDHYFDMPWEYWADLLGGVDRDHAAWSDEALALYFWYMFINEQIIENYD